MADPTQARTDNIRLILSAIEALSAKIDTIPDRQTPPPADLTPLLQPVIARIDAIASSLSPTDNAHGDKLARKLDAIHSAVSDIGGQSPLAGDHTAHLKQVADDVRRMIGTVFAINQSSGGGRSSLRAQAKLLLMVLGAGLALGGVLVAVLPKSLGQRIVPPTLNQSWGDYLADPAHVRGLTDCITASANATKPTPCTITIAPTPTKRHQQ